MYRMRHMASQVVMTVSKSDRYANETRTCQKMSLKGRVLTEEVDDVTSARRPAVRPVEAEAAAN